MQIWPAIDIRDGKCVRLIRGDFSQQIAYSDNPLEMAHHWIEQGAQQLHLVDLDAAKSPLADNNSNDGVLSAQFEVIRRIVEQVNVPCQVGGGIRHESVIQQYLEAGVQQLVIGSQAVQSPQWLEEMANRYPQRLVVGIDAREKQVATHGWLQSSNLTVLELAERVSQLPIAAIVYTDIERDGLMSGPNFDATAELVTRVSVPVIASGGVTTVEDIQRLASINVAGCIVGRALYEQQLELADALAAARSHIMSES